MSGERNPSENVKVTFKPVAADELAREEWAEAVEIIRELARKWRAERKAASNEIDGNKNSNAA